MRIWYFPQLKKFEPIVGFEFEFADADSRYRKEWRVTQVENRKKFSHSWAYRGYPGSSEVQFELFEEGAKCRLEVTHSGLASFPDTPHFARGRFEKGWRDILTINLMNYLEKPTE